MVVQIPYRILPKVSKEDDIWTVSGRPAGDHPDIMQIQRRGDIGRPHDAGSHPSAVKYTTEIQRVRSDGVPEGEERADDIRQTRKPEVQVREPALLSRRLLREHGRTE